MAGGGSISGGAPWLVLMRGSVETRSKMHSVICMLVFSERIVFPCMTGCLSSVVFLEVPLKVSEGYTGNERFFLIVQLQRLI